MNRSIDFVQVVSSGPKTRRKSAASVSADSVAAARAQVSRPGTSGCASAEATTSERIASQNAAAAASASAACGAMATSAGRTAYCESCLHAPLGPAPSSSEAASLRAALHAFLWPGQPATWCSRQQ